MLHIVSRIAFWAAVLSLAADAYFVIFHKGIPNIRTAPAIRSKIIALLKADYEARRPATYTIFDLGSGNGLFTREMARALPQAKVVGIEIARQSIMWASWLKKRHGLANIEYRAMDFLSCDFAEADAVIMYLIPEVLTTLGQKLNREARSGTLITSNKFRLGDGWQPVEACRIKTFYPHQRDLYVYRKA